MPKTLQHPSIYNIPAGIPFVDTLAAGLLKETTDQPETLASYLILLPNRRACRSLQEAFLRQTDGKPILLPKLQAFGDIDADELSITGQGTCNLDIPPAMSPLKRQILLAHTIAKLPKFTQGAQQDMALAGILGQLMDETHTEDLNLSALSSLVPQEDISEHWQITVNFLEILSKYWPRVLKEHGMIDAADRRNRLINALNNHWQNIPPKFSVIAAGSTGSIPATADLLKTISMLPQGSIILPGLDQDMSEAAWRDIEEGHPQTTLKHLLHHLILDGTDSIRTHVKIWPHIPEDYHSDKIDMRRKIISYVMAPSEQTNQWQKLNLSSKQKEEAQSSLENIKRYNCATPQEEAEIISLLLRETLEDKNRTAALITPDRNLARRVAMICHRWGIEIDDSGGQSLAHSQIGTYLRLCAQVGIDGIKPESLLALLKHDYVQETEFKNFRSTVRAMDRDLLRGTTPPTGFDGLKKRYEEKINNLDNKNKPSENILDLILHLEKIISSFSNKLIEGFHSFSDLLNDHIRVAENLSALKTNDGLSSLWKGEDGEAAVNFLFDLQEHAQYIPKLNGRDYLSLLNQFMTPVTIRPRFGTHPRLMILGQLEARLVQTDRVILSGLNEGSWPPDPGHDPWMSRPMRKDFGLPAPERGITLAAHDFVQGFCNKEVFLTRSERVDGTPTVPARWLQRLDTFLQAIEINPDILNDGPHKSYLKLLNESGEANPVSRPEPRPPISTRPKKLSVTKIEKWLKDPYAIYAEKILNLRQLEPLEKKPDAAERGIILHSIMENFTAKYRNTIPNAASNDFITIARDVLEKNNQPEEDWSFWLPRMVRLADWIVPHEQKWRNTAKFIASEVEGHTEISDGLNTPFTLTARADRIDKMHDGGGIIIDYKSGGNYSAKKMQTGELPQLPLEALILSDGGFSTSNSIQQNVSTISYWKLTGGRKAGEITEISNTEKLNEILEITRTGITNLIHIFENEDTPYLAIPRLDKPPAFNDYEYLERVKEWAALGDNNEEAA